MPGTERNRAPVVGEPSASALSRRALLAAVLGTPVLAACSREPEPDAPRLTLDRAWRHVTGTGADVRGSLATRLGLVGDTLVHADGTGSEDARIVARNVADGKQVWTLTGDVTAPSGGSVRVCVLGRRADLKDTAPSEQLVVKAAGGVLPVSYVGGQGRHVTSGVLGVDVRTGRPIWGYEAVPEPSAARTIVTAVSDSVVVVTVTSRLGPHWPAAGHPVRTIALDARTGTELWSAARLVPLAADGEGLVAAASGSPLQQWQPQVLDARTGKARWRGDALAKPADHLATAAGYTVFQPGAGGEEDYVVVRLSTGRRLDFAVDAQPTPVASDPPLLVWDTGQDSAPDPHGFVTRPLPHGDPERGDQRPGGRDFTAVAGAGAYVWGQFDSTRGGLFEPSGEGVGGLTAVDRTGAPCSRSLGAILAAVTERWLVVASWDPVSDSGYRNYFEVYRITPA